MKRERVTSLPEKVNATILLLSFGGVQSPNIALAAGTVKPCDEK